VVWWLNEAIMESGDVTAGKDVCRREGTGSLDAVEEENSV